MANIDSKIPEGPVAEKWTNYKAHQKLVNPKNKRKLDVIVVGTGLAGASAAASRPPQRVIRIAFAIASPLRHRQLGSEAVKLCCEAPRVAQSNW